MTICKWPYFIYLVESIYVGAICPSGNGDVHISKDTVHGAQLAIYIICCWYVKHKATHVQKRDGQAVQLQTSWHVETVSW